MSGKLLKFATNCLTLTGFLMLARGASAQAPSENWIALGNPTIYEASLKALIILFVLAVLIESALAVIFNWRLFLQVFNGLGMKTLIAILVSWIVVKTFDLDVVRELMSVYLNKAVEATWLTKLLTALIVAGGSSGVYNVLVALGYREAKQPEETTPSPPSGKAWISVRARAKNAYGPIRVGIQKVRPAGPGSRTAIAGVIFRRGFLYSLVYVFFGTGRGCRRAAAMKSILAENTESRSTPKSRDGKKIYCPLDGTYVFADRAIVDLYWET